MGGLKDREIVSQQIVAQNEFRITGKGFKLLQCGFRARPFLFFKNPVIQDCPDVPDPAGPGGFQVKHQGTGQQSG